jgi:transcriptional regulator with XRE-family HTH domain
MTLGERFLNYRAKHNISQARLADLLGTNYQFVYRVENNLHKVRRVNEVRFAMKLDELEAKDNVQM